MALPSASLAGRGLSALGGLVGVSPLGRHESSTSTSATIPAQRQRTARMTNSAANGATALLLLRLPQQQRQKQQLTSGVAHTGSSSRSPRSFVLPPRQRHLPAPLLPSSTPFTPAPSTTRTRTRTTARTSLDETSDGAGIPRTWSNPQGEALTELVPGRLWCADRPFIWNSIDVGGRMGVVKLEDGSVWVHSPVQLDAELAAALQGIGPVRHIVSPNFEHCKYAKQWAESYPEAKAYACPGLNQQHPEIGYKGEVGEKDEAPSAWLEEFEVTFLDMERNPFTRKPFFNEVLFLHKPSKALFVTDFFWNYPDTGLPFGSALWKFGMDKIYAPFYKRFMVVDKARLEDRMSRVFSGDWSILVPCHGSVVLENSKGVLSQHVFS